MIFKSPTVVTPCIILYYLLLIIVIVTVTVIVICLRYSTAVILCRSINRRIDDNDFLFFLQH